MIVRLKARRGVPPPLSNPQFQFYDSPIKSSTAFAIKEASKLFQFYDSPIKRPTPYRKKRPDRSFNSMIVRLKEATFYNGRGEA